MQPFYCYVLHWISCLTSGCRNYLACYKCQFVQYFGILHHYYLLMTIKGQIVYYYTTSPINKSKKLNNNKLLFIFVLINIFTLSNIVQTLFLYVLTFSAQIIYCYLPLSQSTQVILRLRYFQWQRQIVSSGGCYGLKSVMSHKLILLMPLAREHIQATAFQYQLLSVFRQKYQ